VDARDAAVVSAIYPVQIRQIAALIRTLGQESNLDPTGVLVTTDFSFGVLRMLEVFVEDVAKIEPFMDEQKARTWLATTRFSE
jgi:hypothetical protein